MLPSATDRKLESKSLKSKKLNKEVYKIIKVENELLVSDNFTGKKHSKKSDFKDLKDDPKDLKDDPKVLKRNPKFLKDDKNKIVLIVNNVEGLSDINPH